MSIQKSIDQLRNARAWRDISSLFDPDAAISDDQKREYRALVRGVSADIQTMGLAQTLAFLLAKDKAHHRNLRGHLTAWLKGAPSVKALIGSASVEEWLRKDQTSVPHMMLATREALSYIVWLKRHAEARISSPESNGAKTL
jgi:CRISPR type III-B/RAMP module-associated protein Cmr5